MSRTNPRGRSSTTNGGELVQVADDLVYSLGQKTLRCTVKELDTGILNNFTDFEHRLMDVEDYKGDSEAEEDEDDHDDEKDSDTLVHRLRRACRHQRLVCRVLAKTDGEKEGEGEEEEEEARGRRGAG